MSLENGHVNLIRRYLLEDLSDEEREQIEQLLMTNDEFYQELRYAEDDLIDDYVLGRLPDEDQPKFKKRFLHAPQLRQSVNFTVALKDHALNTAPVVVAERVPSRATFFESLRRFFTQPAVGLAFSAALLGVIGLNVWLLKQNSQLRSRVGELEARQSASPSSDPLQELRAARRDNEELQARLDLKQQELVEESRKRQLAEAQLKGPTRQPDEAGGNRVFTVALVSGGIRELGSTKRVPLEPDIRSVQFELDLAAKDYPRYSAVLQTDEGQRKWSSSNLKLTAGKILFEVPARRLASGDYHIILSGVKSSGARDDLEHYYFRVP